MTNINQKIDNIDPLKKWIINKLEPIQGIFKIMDVIASWRWDHIVIGISPINGIINIITNTFDVYYTETKPQYGMEGFSDAE